MRIRACPRWPMQTAARLSSPLPSQLATSHLQVECSHIHTIMSPDVQIPPQAGVKAQTTSTLTQLCGFQGAAWLWGTDKADARLSLRADRHFLILNPVSSSVVFFRGCPCALVPTETRRQSTNMLVIWSWLLGGEIWKMTLKQGYLDIPP